MPLIAWYLEQAARAREVDGHAHPRRLGVHFYPTPDGVKGGGIDAATSRCAIRTTRGLWDPTYVDEGVGVNTSISSFPDSNMDFAENYPGRGISIESGAYSAETHMSSGLRGGGDRGRLQDGITSAFYWFVPRRTRCILGLPRVSQLRRQRGALPRKVDPQLGRRMASSLYASVDATGGHMVLVALKPAPGSPRAAAFVMTGVSARRRRACVRVHRRADGVRGEEGADSTMVYRGRYERRIRSPFRFDVGGEER